MISSIETLSPQWDDERDGTFFRIVANLFPPAMVFAAAVLLESYDENDKENDDEAGFGCSAVNRPQHLAGSVTLAR